MYIKEEISFHKSIKKCEVLITGHFFKKYRDYDLLSEIKIYSYLD